MKIEILKSAKGNDQKQKCTGQTPKTPIPQNPGRPTCQKKQKTKEKKTTKRLTYKPSQT